MSLDEQLKFTLANIDQREGGYVVRHGAAVRDFGMGRADKFPPPQNPLAGAYPGLFPYGVRASRLQDHVFSVWMSIFDGLFCITIDVFGHIIPSLFWHLVLSKSGRLF